MKALVTGGCGFMGSHLVEKLVESGHEVVVLDTLSRGNKLSRDALKNIQLINKDMRDQTSVLKAAQGCDIIYHFAAVLGVDIVADNPVETMESESVGMQNIVNAALFHNIEKIVYASTSGIYGKVDISEAVTEETLTSPCSSYSVSKRFNELFLEAQYMEKGLQSVCLRYFNVYGPKQDVRMVNPRFFYQALKDLPITVYGYGEQTRDFTYIHDVIKSTILAAEKVDGCEIINVARGAECTIKELAEKIKNITHSKSDLHCLPYPDERMSFEVKRRFGDSGKLEKLTNYRPQTTLDEGLQKVYESVLSRGDSLLQKSCIAN